MKRAKGMSGKPVTSKPVYGYLEDENYIVDEETAPVVQQISALPGMARPRLPVCLRSSKSPRRGRWKTAGQAAHAATTRAMSVNGRQNTVVHILENREYTGCLVTKTEKPSYKVKHSVENPVEKQAIF